MMGAQQALRCNIAKAVDLRPTRDAGLDLAIMQPLL
jgi:hypothetical protein